MAGEGVSAGGMFIDVGLNMIPLKSAFDKLPVLLTSPLTNAASFLKTALTAGLSSAFDVVMTGDIGGAITRFGSAITHALSGSVRSTLVLVLGKTLGGAIGGALEYAINQIGDASFGFLGKVVTAVVSPINAAMSVSLRDFNLAVTNAITGESSIGRLNAILEASGGAAGYTAQQLDKMATSMSALGGASSFGKGEIREAQTALLAFSNIRGENFAKTLQVAMDIAAAKGGSVASHVSELAHLLGNPEHAQHRLQRQGIHVSDDDQKKIKNLLEANDLMGAQAKLLSLLGDRFKDVASKAAGTTAGFLAQISAQWGAIHASIGAIFLPVTNVLSEMTLNAVKSFGGAVGPVFGNMKVIVENFMDVVRDFLGANKGAFSQWSAYIQNIVGNLWGLIKQGFSALFGQIDPAAATSYWKEFRDGITDVLDKISVFTTSFTNLESVWEIVKSGAAVAFTYIGSKVGDFGDKVADTWDDIVDSFSNGKSAISEAFTDFFGIMGNFLANVLKIGIVAGITEAMKELERRGGYLGGVFAGMIGIGGATEQKSIKKQIEDLKEEAKQELEGAKEEIDNEGGGDFDAGDRPWANERDRDKFDRNEKRNDAKEALDAEINDFKANMDKERLNREKAMRKARMDEWAKGVLGGLGMNPNAVPPDSDHKGKVQMMGLNSLWDSIAKQTAEGGSMDKKKIGLLEKIEENGRKLLERPAPAPGGAMFA